MYGSALMIKVVVGVVGVSLIFGTGFGFAWKIQSTKLDALNNVHTQANINAQKESFLRTEKYEEKVVKAKAKANVRKQVINVAAVVTGNAGNGLRLASKDSLRQSQDSLAACTALNTQYDFVLDSAISEAERLAKAADDWEADALKVLEAWPVK